MTVAAALRSGSAESSPRTIARAAGLFYLATLVAAGFAQGYASDSLFVAGDAAATARNILAHGDRLRLGFAVYVVEMTCQIVLTMLLYELLKPVSRRVSLAAAVLSLTGCIIKTVSRVFFIAPLLVLGDVPTLAAFTTGQREALGLLLFKVNDQGAALAMVFFGSYALLKSWLIIRSTFLPRALGVLSALGGIGWLTYLWSPLGYRLYPVLAVVGLLGAVANIAWLIAYGVDEPRWREQRAAQGTAGA